MNFRFIYRILIAILIVGALYAGSTIGQHLHIPTSGKTTALQAPTFLQKAHAVGEADVLARIDAEAGISAYYKTPDAITISQVRSTFRTIETETADYIIGSVAVPNYVEHFDVHVYAHKSGWILAYYMRGDPVSKIVDAKATTLNTTKLKTVVAAVASAAGAPFSDVTYYDFRYPNATHMLMVAEDFANGNAFTIQLPSSYGYFAREWALMNFNGERYFTVDGIRQDPVWGAADHYYGTLTASQLLPDVPHTITVDDWGVLVLVYRLP